MAFGLDKDKVTSFFNGFVVTVIACIVIGLVVGATFGAGVFVESFMPVSGWTRLMILAVAALGLVFVGILAMLVGKLGDKYGSRLVVTVGGLLLGLGYWGLSRMSAVGQQYLFYGIVVGIGLVGTLIPALSVVASRFVGRRGLVTAVVMAAVPAGAVIFPLSV